MVSGQGCSALLELARMPEHHHSMMTSILGRPFGPNIVRVAPTRRMRPFTPCCTAKEPVFQTADGKHHCQCISHCIVPGDGDGMMKECLLACRHSPVGATWSWCHHPDPIDCGRRVCRLVFTFLRGLKLNLPDALIRVYAQMAAAKCRRSGPAALEAMPRRLSTVAPGDVDGIMQCISADYIQHAYFVTGNHV